MKALNHKERRTAISRFIFSFIPFILLVVLGLILFGRNAREHARFIKDKYNIDRTQYREQALIGEKIDSVLSLYDKIITTDDMIENQYKLTRKEINRTIENAYNYSITRKSSAPYSQLLSEAKEVQAVLDTVQIIKRDLVRNQKQLTTCREIYEGAKQKNKGKKKKKSKDDNNNGKDGKEN